MECGLLQAREGRGFLFEHPHTASSWEHDSVVVLARTAGFVKSTFDVCVWVGFTSEPLPHGKKNSVLGNVPQVHRRLDKQRCTCECTVPWKGTMQKHRRIEGAEHRSAAIRERQSCHGEEGSFLQNPAKKGVSWTCVLFIQAGGCQSLRFLVKHCRSSRAKHSTNKRRPVEKKWSAEGKGMAAVGTCWAWMQRLCCTAMICERGLQAARGVHSLCGTGRESRRREGLHGRRVLLPRGWTSSLGPYAGHRLGGAGGRKRGGRMGQFWAGRVWTFLDDFGRFWTSLDDFGRCWTILDDFGRGGSKIKQTILDDLAGRFWTILGPHGTPQVLPDIHLEREGEGGDSKEAWLELVRCEYMLPPCMLNILPRSPTPKQGLHTSGCNPSLQVC